jgi:DNA-binding transcriptional regulator GbsR (MarR family)
MNWNIKKRKVVRRSSVIVKRNEKKHYYSYGDDIHSIKDLIEEKRKEIREIEANIKKLPKNDTMDNEEKTERDKLKRKIKYLEKEIRELQRNL